MRCFVLPLLLLAAGWAHAEINVVATTTNMAMLSKEVGGEAVNVRSLAPPDRDPHHLEARPSMIAATRRADLVLAVGAELEVGWLPAVLDSASNPDVRPGHDGYFEAAEHVSLIDAGQAADRARGDVHPGGNPHLYLDPERMADVADALAERLAELAPERNEEFRDNAQAFREKVDTRLPEWRERVADAPGVLLFHKDANYLMRLLDVPILGYVEPIPGVPPGAEHLRSLVREHQGREGVILHTDFNPSRGPEFLERELEWPRQALPTAVPRDGTAADYFDMIDRWVDAVTATG